MRIARFVVVLFITAILEPVVKANGPSGDAIRFSLDENGAIVVPVIVDGAGPFPFLLDTGSTDSGIGESLVAQLGAPVVAKASLATSVGARILRVARISRVTVGSAAIDELLPTVMPDRMLNGEHARGVIGQDFLGRMNYTLDYRHRLLSWNAPSVPPPGRLPLEWMQGRFLVLLRQAGGDGRVLRFVPDTGSASVVLFARPGMARPVVQPVPNRVRLTTLAGERDVECGLMRTLQVGLITWREEPVVIVDRPEHDALEGDGLLPLHRFSRVSFNTRERYMAVE